MKMVASIDRVMVTLAEDGILGKMRKKHYQHFSTDIVLSL